ncbi:hypothetical protein D2Q93_13915 [Alicyclobacillaceae bacterium I2511]|nr:hypothetical protein D2Q93_13915 [Alicyclobacillaceae bacterium I2511]
MWACEPRHACTHPKTKNSIVTPSGVQYQSSKRMGIAQQAASFIENFSHFLSVCKGMKYTLFVEIGDEYWRHPWQSVMYVRYAPREGAEGCPMQTTIIVDADAMPRDALATVDRLSHRFGAAVVTVSSINHEFSRPGHVVVDAHPQATDMEIVSRLKKGQPFVVVTQDYGLAALALGQGARVISPHGLIFTANNIDLFLAERDLNSHQRRATGRSRGPRARTKVDADRFEQSLITLLNENWP